MNMPTMRVDGKVCLVTGAGSGLGKAMAHGLAHFGADVIITEIPAKLELGQQVAQELAEATGKKVICLPLSLPDLNSIDRMVSQAVEKMGRVDVLVNNAGVQVAKFAL